MRHMICCLLLLALIGMPAYAQELPDASTVLDYITQNPEDVAILCYTPGEAAQIAHNADEPFPLASTYKLVILAELARQTDLGLIDPNEAVPLADVNAYWLPNTDGHAHQMFLDTLPPEQDTLTVQAIANGMIQFSSNAAADYLFARLDLDGYPDLFQRLGLENTDLPTSTFLGLYLAAENHESGRADLDTLDAERERLENLFLTDAAWRDAEIDYWADRVERVQQAIADQNYEALMEDYAWQASFFERFGFKGSARDMLRIIESAYQGDTFSERGQAVMQEALGWLMRVNPANREVYDALGTKGGTWAAILTGAWYAEPKDGDPILLAVFYRDLPFEVFGEWSANFTHQTLEVRAVAYGEGCDVFADAVQG